MRSIRNQLVRSLVAGVLVLAAAAGVGLYAYMGHVLQRGLDGALSAKAEAIAAAVHMEDDGQPHLQPAMTGDRGGAFRFRLWRADGRTLASTAPLPRPAGDRRFANVTLPDGTAARAAALSFVAGPDEDQFDPAPAHPLPAGERLTLVVARDRRPIDGPLAVLLSGLLLAAAAVTGGIVLIVTLGVRRGLRPLAAVSALADRIGPDSLGVRFPGREGLPPELLPIGTKLNDLLDRLQEAFARERRFSAAVAHELRTPLAELRTLCEVTLRWPDDRGALAAAVGEAMAIAVEMGTMVQTLLALARCQASVELPRAVVVCPARAVEQAWSDLATDAADRDLVVCRELDDAGDVRTDPDMLAAVLRNLLGNAVAHARCGGRIGIRTAAVDGGVAVHIANTCHTLTPDDLPHLTEPFWRKSAARTGGTHVGLGLALVAAYCRAMGATVTADLESPDWFAVTLRLPSAATPV